jgi:hypothetical protein
LCLWVLTITFMSVDWVMSLDPHWYSTIFGVLTLGGQGLSTLAFTIIVLAALVKFQPMSQVAEAENVPRPRKLMFAFTMLWAYFSVSQLLIIWSANLPEEIPFYLERCTAVAIRISVSAAASSRSRSCCCSRAASSATRARWPASPCSSSCMRVVDITWTIGPVFRHEGSTLTGSTSRASLGLGCLWLPLFFRNLAGRRSCRRTIRTTRRRWRMSHTDHAHAQPPTAPVEGDGISYSGIIWFVVILTVTTLFCQALVWGMFEYWAHRAVTNEAVRSPLLRR